MATTIQSGRASSPLLTADVASRAEVYGGRGLVFDGASDYLDCGTGLGNKLGDNYSKDSGLTISLWFKADETNVTRGLLSISSFSDSFGQLFIRLASNELQFKLNNNWTRSVAFTDLGWNHIAVVYADTKENSKMYLNGTAVGSESGSFPSSLNLNGLKTVIGGFYSSSFTFNGSMADVKIHSSALTEAEITSQYLKPESVPSPSSLVAWYPMCESNPESPQSIVYDHSEKGLGSELVGDTSFDVDLPSGSNANISLETQATVSSGKLVFTANSPANPTVTLTKLSQNILASGKLYKLSFTIANASDDGTNSTDNIARINWQMFSGSDHANYGNGTHTLYGTADALTADFNISGASHSFEMTDISIKEVLMGNHATTNFFGSELNPNPTFSNFTGNVPDGWGVVGDDDSGNNISQGSAGGLRIQSDGGSIFAHLADVNVVGKTYQFSITIANVNDDDFSFKTSNTKFFNADGKSAGTYTGTYVAEVTYVRIFRDASCDGEITAFSLKEVGISSSGFATAQNEPVIPQIPLVKYNEKMFFDGVDDKVSVTSNNLGTVSTVSLWLKRNNPSGRDEVVLGEDTYNSDYLLFIGGSGLSHEAYIRINNTALGYSANLNDTNWHHLVFSRNGDSISLYKDGVLISTKTGFGTSVSTAFDTIGSKPAGSTFLQGNIEEVSSFNTAFSSIEVQELFNDGVALDATTHSKSGNLLGYWRNDGVTTWQDRRGWSYLNFDGTGDFVQASLSSNTVGQTYSFWWNTTNTAVNKSLFELKQDSTFRARFYQDYAYQFRIGTQADSNYVYAGASGNSTGVYNNGAWHHILVYIDNTIGSSKVYANGVALTMSGASGSSSVGTSNTLIIGNKAGSISQFAVWSGDKTSSASGIYATGVNGNLTNSYSTDLIGYWKLNNATTVTDLSSNGNNGTVNGNPTLNTGNTGTVAGSPDSITIREGLNSNKDGLGFPLKNPSSNVLRLNGSSEYVDAGSTKSLDDMWHGGGTILMWLKPQGSTTNMGIMNKAGNGNQGWMLKTDGALSSGAWKFRFDVVFSGATYSWQCTGGLPVNEWNHYAIVLNSTDGQQMTVYKNGVVLSPTNSPSNTNGTYASDAGQDLIIGSKEALSTKYNGLMDEIMLYNKALTVAEINKNYKFSKGKHKND